jgi:predicted ATPase/DNA-binding CsgD family transcriptional regulator
VGVRASVATSRQLPRSRTSFVGRARELDLIGELLAAGHPVTLTGPGGSGKTRLALEAGRRHAGLFPDGCVLVELAGVRSPAAVAPAVAGSIGVRGRAGEDLPKEIAEALGDHRILLLLDNCEHLPDACADLASMLMSRCEGLGILATSRMPLRIDGERVLGVPPLRTDEEALPLFVDRAQAAAAGFCLDESNHRHLVAICRRLDGIPLAIELAATWVAVMTPAELLPLLDRRFEVLGGGTRGAAEHQRTLRATVDWSHELLGSEEKALFRRLSVFAGSFTREAAEAVCADQAGGDATILPTLAALCGSSMVLAESAGAGTTRYRLLETLRAYGLERLRAAGEEETFRVRHLLYLTDLAERAYAERMRGGPRSVVEVLQAERDNVRAALEWGREHDPGAALGLAGTLVEDVRRSLFGFREMRQLLTDLLACAPEATQRRARALFAAGQMALAGAEDAEALELVTASCHLSEQLDDRWGEAWAHLALGMCAWLNEDLPTALEQYRRSEVLHAQLGNRFGAYRARVRGAMARASASPPPAGSLAELSALAVEGQEVGDPFGTGLALSWLGMLVLARGAGGATDAACAHFLASIEVLRPSGDPVIAVPLAGLAVCFVGVDADLALRLLGAADAHFRTQGLRKPPGVQRFIEDGLARATLRRGERDARAAYAAGAGLSFDEAVALASAGPGARPAVRPHRRLGELTEREAEVARLVAAGLTNREIAESLVLSVRTVETHVDRILTKVGLHNRSRLAVWLQEQRAGGS